MTGKFIGDILVLREGFNAAIRMDDLDGIGGRVGMVVGEKLWQLGRRHEVLCVTHLPQLAAFGDQHFRVLKQVDSGRTTTHVEQLGEESRLEELAQMLGASGDGAIKSAKEILKNVADEKKIVASGQ